MLVLDNFVDMKGGTIEIPWYHIGHLSLTPDTDLTLCFIPQDETNCPSMDEIVVSPINFDSWDGLWRINAVFVEKNGIVNDVLEVLKSEGANVLQAETVSSDNRDFHQMEIIIDARQIIKKGKNTPEEELTKDLERRLIAYAINSVCIDIKNHAMLKVRKMKGLDSSYQKYITSSSSGSAALYDTSTIKNRKLKIPSEMMRRLRDNNLGKCLLVSDTKERILRIFLADKNDGYTYVQIQHNDRIGVLADITRCLRHDFDIVNSLTKIRSQNNRNTIELLLKSEHYAHSDQEIDRRKMVDKCLRSKNLEDYSIEYGFPASIGKSCKMKKIKRYEGDSDFSIDPLLSLPTIEIAVSRKQDIASKNDGSGHYEKSKRAYILDKISREERGYESIGGSIFVSYNFSCEAYFNSLSAVISEFGYDVVNGKDPDEYLTMRDSIIDRISTCDAFVGLWTGDANSFSPWLLWELGVAHTLQKPFKLLIAPEVPDEFWKKINSESAQYLFQPPEFSIYAAKALTALQRMLRVHVAASRARDDR